LEELRVYQDAKVESRIEEGRSLIIRQLTCKVGKISKSLVTKIEELPLNSWKNWVKLCYISPV